MSRGCRARLSASPNMTPRTLNAKTAKHAKRVKKRCLPRQPERDELGAIRRAADGQNQVLLAVVQVGHRRAGLRCRHVNGAELLSRRLVVGAEHRAALSV